MLRRMEWAFHISAQKTRMSGHTIPPFVVGLGGKNRDGKRPLALVKTDDGLDVKQEISACDHTTREWVKHRSRGFTSYVECSALYNPS